MLDLNTLNKRYFDVKIGEYNLQLEPCKLKTLQKITGMNKDADISELIDIASTILNKNKTNFVVSHETIEDLNVIQLFTLIQAFIEWQVEEKTINPN